MNIKDIYDIVGKENVKLNEPLSNHTTFKVGGNAEYYITPKTTDSLVDILDYTKENSIQRFILGGGSDIVVSDKGIRGFVIKPENNFINIGDKIDFELGNKEMIQPRHETKKGSIESIKSLDDLKYREDEDKKVKVTVGAGVSLPYLIGYTLANSLCGLHWFGYIPSNIGGAVFNNIHGLDKFFSNYIESAKLWKEGSVIEKNNSQLEFGYDISSVQKYGEVVLEVTFNLYKGDSKKAQYTYQEMVKRKVNNQPNFPSAGSVFKNIDPKEKERQGLPSISAGWLIDQAGLLGTRVGGAQVYEKHGNFIINRDNATYEDIKSLVKMIQDRVYDKWKIKLEPEIKFIEMES